MSEPPEDPADVPVEEVDEAAGAEVQAAPEAGSPPGTATGHPAVDEVLRSLDALDGRPLEEHVAAFEQAHEQLRRALSGAGDDTT